MKIFTTACLIGSLILCFIFMSLFARAGNRHLLKAERVGALTKMEVTLALIVGCVIGATVGAIMIVRAARKAYREEAIANMNYLIELAKVKAKEEPDA